MKKIYKMASIITLYVLFIVEVLCILFFGGTAINVGITIIFPQAGIDAPQKGLMHLLYLPFLLLGMSGGFMWLAFKTAKIINRIRGVEKSIDQSFYNPSESWKMIVLVLLFVLIVFYVMRR